MKKIEKQYMKKENIIHKFYCSECEKFLGESIEFEDGYYQEYGNCELAFFFNKTWYKYKNNLCERCRNVFYKCLEDELKLFGFSDKEED